MYSDIYNKPPVNFDPFAKIYHNKHYKMNSNQMINNSFLYSLNRNLSNKKLVNNIQTQSPTPNNITEIREKLIEIPLDNNLFSPQKKRIVKSIYHIKSSKYINSPPLSPKNSIISVVNFNSEKKENNLKQKILNLDFKIKKTELGNDCKFEENGKFLFNRNLYLKKIYSKYGNVNL